MTEAFRSNIFVSRFYKVRVSRFLSYILRHAPARYGLQPDQNGYVEFEKVFQIMSQRFRYLKKDHLINLVERDFKNRFEIADGKIRTTYGRSTQVIPKKD